MDTLTSLQIIEQEAHHNSFKQSHTKSASGSASGAKDNVSIYGLFQKFSRTPQGKKRLKQIFLRPCTDMEIINQRHNFISIYLQSVNISAIEKLYSSLKKIKNLRPIMTHLRKGVSSGNAKIRDFRSGIWETLLEVSLTIDNCLNCD